MLDVLARALDAGVRLVQLREKDLDKDVLEALAEQVLSLTAPYDAMLLINSVADIAVKIGAQVCICQVVYCRGRSEIGLGRHFNRLFHTYLCGIRLR